MEKNQEAADLAEWAFQHPINVLGASTFWLYILFALIFTGIILQSLYIHLPPPKRPERQRADRIFGLLALLSFCNLSYHMLGFLVHSYRSWAQSRVHGGLDIENGKTDSRASIRSILHWSLTSTLFQDFGREIVLTNARYTWIVAALWVTFIVDLNMGLQMATRRLTHSWAFIGLGQILPISFTQNLLYISQIRVRRGRPVPWESTAFQVGILLAAVAYATFPAAVPAMVDTPNLLWSIAFIRSLLLVSPVLAVYLRGAVSHKDKTRGGRSIVGALVTALAIVATSVQINVTLQESSVPAIGDALFANPAVSALGTDFIISMVSSLLWSVFGVVEE